VLIIEVIDLISVDAAGMVSDSTLTKLVLKSILLYLVLEVTIISGNEKSALLISKN
jgi:hypothetical protein